MKGPFWRGYYNSVTNLHGWDDGDPYLVNYVGHPMQGAIASYIWAQNDGTYRYAEFGRNRDYWKSRFRSLGFSYAYSLQFEIGPVSEATLGNVQAKYPAQGFVDHIITPVIGLGWMVGEDMLDRFVIVPFEKRVDNAFARMMMRSWLNPSRSFANLMRMKVPWYRDNRGSILLPYREYGYRPNYPEVQLVEGRKPWQTVAPFEFSANTYALVFPSHDNGGACVGGGGGQAAWNAENGVSWVLEVNGCKMYGMRQNSSGDALTFLTGPRYTWRSASRLMPYAQLLVGGHKLTEEAKDGEAFARLVRDYGTTNLPNELRDEYKSRYDAVGFAASLGGGVDMGINRYMTVRLANLEYTYFHQNRPLNGQLLRHGARFNFGLVLRMGTW